MIDISGYYAEKLRHICFWFCMVVGLICSAIFLGRYFWHIGREAINYSDPTEKSLMRIANSLERLEKQCN